MLAQDMVYTSVGMWDADQIDMVCLAQDRVCFCRNMEY